MWGRHSYGGAENAGHENTGKETSQGREWET